MAQKFRDFGKNVRDFFDDDYEDNYSVEASGKYGGVNVKTETTIDDSISGKYTLKWKHSCGFELKKFEFKGLNDFKAEGAYAVNDDIKVTGTYASAGDGTVKLDYTTSALTVNAKANALEFSGVDLDVSLAAVDDLTVGAGVKYSTEKGLKAYDVGAAYKFGDWSFAWSSSNQLKNHDVFANFALNKDVSLGAKISSDATGTLGASYSCNPDTNIKAKADNDCNVGVAVTQQLADGVSATAAVAVPNLAFENFQLGVKFTLG